MSSIQFEQLAFSYDEPFVSVLEEVDLTIDTTWRLGLIGPNGRGKTTLFRLLSKARQPTRGALRCPVACRTFPYVVTRPERTTRAVIRDAIAPFSQWEDEMAELAEQADDDACLARYGELLQRYEAHNGYAIDAWIEKELASLGMDAGVLERPYASLSGGEQTRALLLPLFAHDGEFPLIDEPTNHLDLQGRERVAQYLARKHGFIVASHDRHFLASCVDHVLVMQPTGLRLHRGGYSDWEAQRALEDEHDRRRRANLKREIRSFQQAARQRREWSHAKERQKRGAPDKGFIGHMAARQMKRALVIQRRAEERVDERRALLENVEKERRLVLDQADGAPEVLLEVSGLSLGFDRPLVENLSFRLEKGQRIAVMGPNGSGKSTLLRTLAGQMPALAGSFRLPPWLVPAYSCQLPRWSQGLLRDLLREAQIDEPRFRTLMGCFGLEGEVFDRDLGTFSEGQRKKVDLCRSFLSPSHLLIWDEPMNYIDIAARELIESVIAEAGPTMLFVEHDRRFVERVATGVLELV